MMAELLQQFTYDGHMIAKVKMNRHTQRADSSTRSECRVCFPSKVKDVTLICLFLLVNVFLILRLLHGTS